ncbi:MAG TPA: PQQ-dependent sugar dehydrogenase [bacterium]|nr:PQQ-dependent sugar dehydrogenase [bacterium]
MIQAFFVKGLLGILFLSWISVLQARAQSLALIPHRLELPRGKTITLSIPQGWDITVAAQGMKRPRFMAFSPDGRLFLGDMYNMDDTRLGHVYVLDNFDPQQGKFQKLTAYLSRQRNPNSVAFYTDTQGRPWLYVALTDHLVRYPYQTGDLAPSSAPQTLAAFPDYGLNYKYGGWHLTRTVLAGENGKLYVSVGSSCDSCVEKPEETRACVLEMDPDGKNQHLFASGIRNAVGLRWVNGKIMATDMGADKLGDDLPLESIYELEEGQNYGWPYAYVSPEGYKPDPKYSEAQRPVSLCENAPPPYWTYIAHASPLGIEYFDDAYGPDLAGHYLVAFHGSSKKGLNHGYRVMRMVKGERGEDFITGFLEGDKVLGRPCGILRDGKGGFFLTDDFNGVVYFLRPTSSATVQP